MKKEYILLGILVVVLLAAGLWIFQIISEYQRADQEYEELKEYVKEAEEEEQDQKEGEADDYSGVRHTGLAAPPHRNIQSGKAGGRREQRSRQRRGIYR